MKQVLQDLKNGTTNVVEVPAPSCSASRLLVRTRRTLISAGTEKMLVEFGQAGLLGKARAQPDKVKQVLAKIKTDGMWPTIDAVFSKLGEPLPLGYCNAGIVEEVGRSVSGVEVGQRVVSNAPHAEFASVSPLLTAAIPDRVSDDEAAFTVLASIGLQGIRLIQPTLGESVVVYGLGLIGLVTVQLLKNCGCRVIGVDINSRRLELAAEFGAETVNAAQCDSVAARVVAMTDGRGADAVLITASAKTDSIVSDAAKMSRKRGRVVLVGVVGLQLNRNDFYEKEISFQVSCSYGPGRYDDSYESKNQDYPIGFVRWTQQRNFEAILQLLAEGRLDFRPLISHAFSIEDAPKAYECIQQDPSSLGVVLEFSNDASKSTTLQLTERRGRARVGEIVAAVIGAGNFTRATLLPAIKSTEIAVKYLAGRSKMGSVHNLATKFGIEQATSSIQQALDDDAVNLVMLTTNHDSHASLACQALKAGKSVFVEKPLAVDEGQLKEVLACHAQAPGSLMVGFNRRFSPHIEKCVDLLSSRNEPVAISINVNAGAIPADHWVHDPIVGGGRIIGEACHFLDLVICLSNSKISILSAHRMGESAEIRDDKMTINGHCEDGTVFSVNYFANGSNAFPKESIEIYSDGRVLRINNFRETRGFGFKKFSNFKTRRQEKGHRQQFQRLAESLKQGEALIPVAQIVNTTLASFAAVESAKEMKMVSLAERYSEIV